MPNITFTILGTPIGFDCIPTDRSQYYRQYYDGSTIPEKLVIERNKSRIDYVYLRYGLFSSGGRSGSFIGLALSFEGEYCSTPLLLAELLRSIYANLLKIGVITQGKTSEGKDLIQYSKEYAQFSKLEPYIKQITPWINQQLREEVRFRGTILPMDSSFQGQENARSMMVLPWDEQKTSEEQVVNTMRRYPYMELQPNATSILIKVSPEDRLWLANYKTYLEGKKSIKNLDSQVKAVEFESSQYTLRKDAYKAKEEHIVHLEHILAMIKGALLSLREVIQPLQKEGERITMLREELKKIGNAGVAKEAEDSNKDQITKCKDLSSLLTKTEETMLILLQKYRKTDPRPNSPTRPHSKPTPDPKPKPQPLNLEDDEESDPEPRQSFFRRALGWMVSHKKGCLYILLILFLAGGGVYTYKEFFSEENSSERDRRQEVFDESVKKINDLIKNQDFCDAKVALTQLEGDTTFSKHFASEIGDLKESYQTAGFEYFKKILEDATEFVKNPKRNPDSVMEVHCAKIEEKIYEMPELGPLNLDSLISEFRQEVITYYSALLRVLEENKRKDAQDIIKKAREARVSADTIEVWTQKYTSSSSSSSNLKGTSNGSGEGDGDKDSPKKDKDKDKDKDKKRKRI